MTLKKNMLFSITLNSGRIVDVDSISISRTYGVVLVGGKEAVSLLNKEIIDNDLKCPTDWGQRKTYIMPPDENRWKEVLPPTIFKVWLISDAINSGNDGSHLVLIWFGDLENEKSIKENIENVIKNVEWEKHAEDFCF